MAVCMLTASIVPNMADDLLEQKTATSRISTVSKGESVLLKNLSDGYKKFRLVSVSVGVHLGTKQPTWARDDRVRNDLTGSKTTWVQNNPPEYKTTHLGTRRSGTKRPTWARDAPGSVWCRKDRVQKQTKTIA